MSAPDETIGHSIAQNLQEIARLLGGRSALAARRGREGSSASHYLRAKLGKISSGDRVSCASCALSDTQGQARASDLLGRCDGPERRRRAIRQRFGGRALWRTPHSAKEGRAHCAGSHRAGRLRASCTRHSAGQQARGRNRFHAALARHGRRSSFYVVPANTASF